MEATPMHAYYHIHVHATKTARAYDMPNVPAERLQKNINKLTSNGLDIEVRSGGVLQPAAPTRRTVENILDTPKKAKVRKLVRISPEPEPIAKRLTKRESVQLGLIKGKEKKVKEKKPGYQKKSLLEKVRQVPVICITTQAFFHSATKAGEAYGIGHSNIMKAIHGTRKHASGKLFRPAQEQEIREERYIPIREQI